MTLLQRISGLAQSIGADIGYLISKVLHHQNITVTAIADSAEVSHTLNATKLCITFYDDNGQQRHDIGYEIIDNTKIKIYLPLLDEEAPATFSGDIFIIKRT